MAEYKVREEGKNGTVQVLPDRIVRTIKKHLGRDDTQTIPLKAVHEVKIERRIGRGDTVKIATSAGSYEWKSGAAQALHDEIQSHLFA
jgi:hypothetical protein